MVEVSTPLNYIKNQFVVSFLSKHYGAKEAVGIDISAHQIATAEAKFIDKEDSLSFISVKSYPNYFINREMLNNLDLLKKLEINNLI